MLGVLMLINLFQGTNRFLLYIFDPSFSETVFTSLSPLPEQLMTISELRLRVGQSVSRYANAWAVSSAGIIPSNLLTNCRASIASFPFSVLHLPLSQAANWTAKIGELLPKDQSIVIVCHAGVRSLNFGIWLLEQGITKSVWNLVGGIDAWSTDVDQSIPRY